MNLNFDPVDKRPLNGEAVEPKPGDMATEPALTVGEIFADKAMIRPVVSAAVGIIAQVLNMTVSDDLTSNITLVVTFIAMAYTAYSAQTGKAESAREQAAATREVVYSPATVTAIAEAAAETGDSSVEPPPADAIRSVMI